MTTPQTWTNSNLARTGREMYERDLRDKLETTARGKFVVIDVTSGDYEVAGDDLEASLALLARRPNALTWGVRIGSQVAYRVGFRFGDFRD